MVVSLCLIENRIRTGALGPTRAGAGIVLPAMHAVSVVFVRIFLASAAGLLRRLAVALPACLRFGVLHCGCHCAFAPQIVHWDRQLPASTVLESRPALRALLYAPL